MEKLNERELCVDILTDILNNQGYNNVVLRRTLRKHLGLSAVQKAFITDVVNGVLRNMTYIDHCIDSISKTPTTKMKPFILNNLRVAFYQISFMNKIPASAAANEAVELAKKRGFSALSGFVNGVVRNFLRQKDAIVFPDENVDPVGFLSTTYSHPKWLVKMWLESYDFGFVKQLCFANNAVPKISIAVNTLKTTTHELKEILQDEGVLAEESALVENCLRISKMADLTQRESFKQGLYHVQDESSMLAVCALDPKPGETVYDVCAAPGGKSFLSAYKMGNRGEIIARDVHPHKVELIDEAAKRLGIDIICPQEHDSTMVNGVDYNRADKLLVDAPCSGFGLLSKKPDIKISKQPEDIAALVKLQRQILAASAEYVRPGGTLIYSTCTICEAENMGNVKWFLENFQYEMVSVKQFFPHVDGCDGFFIAKFSKL